MVVLVPEKASLEEERTLTEVLSRQCSNLPPLGSTTCSWSEGKHFEGQASCQFSGRCELFANNHDGGISFLASEKKERPMSHGMFHTQLDL